MRLLFLILILFPSLSLGSRRDEYKQAVHTNSAKFSSCYQKALKRIPDLHGTVVLAWTVDDKGTADRVFIKEDKTTLKDRLMNKCLINELKTWTFPPAQEGSLVEIVAYPFVFINTAK